MIASEIGVEPPRAAGDVQRFTEAVLDDLEVVERAYHHLNFSVPLTADLLRRARAGAHPGSRVLLVGGSTLLAEALVRMGFELDIWQLGGSYLTDDMQARVCRRIGAAELDAAPAGDREYALIIVPLVIEALSDPARFLRVIRASLLPDGRVLLATANQSRLNLRLAALRGRPFIPHGDAAALSLSWPALPTQRHYHRDEVRSISRDAGFGVMRQGYVSSERAFLEMEPLNVQDYLARKLRSGVMRAIPSMRDALVLELAPRPGGRLPVKTPADHLTVSVVLAVVHGGDRLRASLAALTAQTYDAALYEIIVLHDGRREDTSGIIARAAGDASCAVRNLRVVDAHSPEARDAAMAAAAGDITAHTDDGCRLPEDWLQAAAGWFDADTAVIGGPVFAAEGSEPRYLDPPCSRPDPDDKGIASRTMFPISNVFYRTAIALAAGGFTGAARALGGAGLGWDTALAWRLQGAGWRARFRDEVYAFGLFVPESSRAWPRAQFRQAAQLPVLLARLPEYRERVAVGGVFASKQTMYFDLAVVGAGVALGRRRWPALLLVLPWCASISQRIDLWPVTNWPRSLRTAARIGARQSVWLAGLVRGSIKARRPLL